MLALLLEVMSVLQRNSGQFYYCENRHYPYNTRNNFHALHNEMRQLLSLSWTRKIIHFSRLALTRFTVLFVAGPPSTHLRNHERFSLRPVNRFAGQDIQLIIAHPRSRTFFSSSAVNILGNVANGHVQGPTAKRNDRIDIGSRANAKRAHHFYDAEMPNLVSIR